MNFKILGKTEKFPPGKKSLGRSWGPATSGCLSGAGTPAVNHAILKENFG
jgi:hypothetical protein